MKAAPVSVVIPTYNRRDIVPDAIDSVLAQTVPPAQIIVVDDGGRDDTAGRLALYGKGITYHRQDNAGLSAARNKGIHLATQPLIAFLDDDDVWHPRKLELQMRCIEQDQGIDLLGTDCFDWPVLSFPHLAAGGNLPIKPVTWEQLAVKTSVTICTVLLRRAVIDRVGNFDVTLPSSEDWDWLLRVAQVARRHP